MGKTRDIVEHRDDAGQLHRTDGPALEYPDGSREWYVDDFKIVSGVEVLEQLAATDPALLREVLTVWRPDGPDVVDLANALLAARL